MSSSSSHDLSAIVARLDKLERENKRLRQENAALHRIYKPAKEEPKEEKQQPKFEEYDDDDLIVISSTPPTPSRKRPRTNYPDPSLIPLPPIVEPVSRWTVAKYISTMTEFKPNQEAANFIGRLTAGLYRLRYAVHGGLAVINDKNAALTKPFYEKQTNGNSPFPAHVYDDEDTDLIDKAIFLHFNGVNMSRMCRLVQRIGVPTVRDALASPQSFEKAFVPKLTSSNHLSILQN